MDHDSTDHPEPPRKARRGSQPDLPPQDLIAADVDPATSAAEEDDEARLPEARRRNRPRRSPKARWRSAMPPSKTRCGWRRPLPASTACSMPASDVLYVGKAKNVRKRLSSYARVNAPLPARILRMIAATVTVEIVSTTTETEALLLEANLIKQLRPRFNVQLRDDKSFPYILIIRRPLGAADPQASRRAIAARAIFRAVRIRRRRQPHHHGAAARLPDPLLHRRLLREPHPALPALSDPPLLGPLHRRDRLPRLYRAGARGQRLPVRPQPCR